MPTPISVVNDPKPTPRTVSRVRRDLLVIGIVILVGCAVVLYDPDNFFEWLAQNKAAKIDEFLVAIVIIGAGFAIFSWRRWTDLSRQVAEYKRLQVELSAINREASMMSETDDLLQSCLSSEEACKVIIRHIESQLPSTSGAICIVNTARTALEVVTQWGQPALVENTFATTDCWALRRGRINVSSASKSQLTCAHISSQRPPYAMCVPMMAQSEILGVLYLDSGKPGADNLATHFQALSEAEERAVKTLAEHLALALASLNLRETLRTQSIRDPLTGLFNRRYLEETLERELPRMVRKKSSLGVMMIDVDHFKRFNDTFGHDAGDTVLKDLAQLFRDRLRAEDIACRYGGEEFTMILPEANLEAVQQRAEQLRQAVETSHFNFHGESLGPVTISVGIACYPQHGSAVETLLRVAGRALYRAKEEGRNRVITA